MFNKSVYILNDLCRQYLNLVLDLYGSKIVP